MNETVQKILQRYKSISKEADLRRDEMQEVAEYLQPSRADFFGSLTKDAEDRIKIFDSTPEDCLQNLAAYLHSNLTSPFHSWFNLSLIGGDEADSQTVKEWLDDVEKKMLAKFNSDEGGFHTAVHELWMDLPSLGNGGFFIDNPRGNTIIFSSVAPSQFKVAENADGKVDTVFNEYEWTARQIFETYPKTCSSAVKEAYEKSPDQKFKILHAIMPRPKFKEGKVVRPKDMKIGSYCIEITSGELLKESGFHEFPFPTPRWSKRSGETIGRGIGQRALPDIRVLNEIERSGLIAAEKAADPVTLLPHDGFVGLYGSDGGAMNFHRFQGDIREKVMTIGSDADLNAIEAKAEQKRNSIRRMFLNDKILPMEKAMTATEYTGIQAEKLLVLGPVLGRLQSEFLAPVVSRVFGIMYRNGEFGEIPQELQGKELKIQYVSPVSRAQKQVDAQSFNQAMAYLAPIASINPKIFDHFDFDHITRDTQPMFGYPSKNLKALDVIKKERQAQAEAMKKQSQMVEANAGLELAGKAKELQSNERPQ